MLTTLDLVRGTFLAVARNVLYSETSRPSLGPTQLLAR